MGKQSDRTGRPCFCPGCLTVLPLRFDKHQRPYFRCQVCSLTIFMGTEFAQVAFLMWQGVIQQAPKRWVEKLKTLITAKTKADYAAKMHEAKTAAP